MLFTGKNPIILYPFPEALINLSRLRYFPKPVRSPFLVCLHPSLLEPSKYRFLSPFCMFHSQRQRSFHQASFFTIFSST